MFTELCSCLVKHIVELLLLARTWTTGKKHCCFNVSVIMRQFQWENYFVDMKAVQQQSYSCICLHKKTKKKEFAHFVVWDIDKVFQCSLAEFDFSIDFPTTNWIASFMTLKMLSIIRLSYIQLNETKFSTLWSSTYDELLKISFEYFMWHRICRVANENCCVQCILISIFI